VVLTVLSLGMAGYLLLGGDDPAPHAATDPAADGAIDVPEDRPILLPWADAQAAASAASEATTTIIGTSWQDYDDQVEEAVALMTPAFAEEYRETAGGATRQGIVDGKIEVQVRVVSQSVVRANTSQAQVLLFLNQYITKPGEDGQGGTTVSPYRALVTVVNTDGGWLVADLQTR
jgi:Mce-associated membrane protein